MISLVNSKGIIMRTVAANLSAGPNEIAFPMLTETTGLYFLQVQSKFGSQALRIIKH